VSELVDACQCGVGREDGALHFTTDLWSFNHVVPKSDNTIEVRVRPLDEILAGRIPLIIKIDVEGFESEVLAGAAQTLANPSCAVVIMEIADYLGQYGSDSSALSSTMKDYGFTPFWYEPLERTLTPPGESRERRANQVFIRNIALIQERIKSAPVREVHGTKF
jgi:hypothetical protein